MSIGLLVKAEAIKLARLRPFWMVLAAYIGFLLFMSDSAVTSRREPMGFPLVWPGILEVFTIITLILTCAMVLITVSSEFMWRTSRQNVIDGLSKTEWYTAKFLSSTLILLLFVILGLAVIVSYVTIAGPDRGAAPLMRASDARLLGAALLGIFGYVSFGFFLALTVRNSGAVALFFAVYCVFIENMAAGLLRIYEHTLIAQFLLVSVFAELWKPHRWDPAALERAAKFNRLPPDAFSNDQVLALASGYIVFFLVAAYVIYQKRDL